MAGSETACLARLRLARSDRFEHSPESGRSQGLSPAGLAGAGRAGLQCRPREYRVMAGGAEARLAAPHTEYWRDQVRASRSGLGR